MNPEGPDAEPQPSNEGEVGNRPVAEYKTVSFSSREELKALINTVMPYDQPEIIDGLINALVLVAESKVGRGPSGGFTFEYFNAMIMSEIDRLKASLPEEASKQEIISRFFSRLIHLGLFRVDELSSKMFSLTTAHLANEDEDFATYSNLLVYITEQNYRELLAI